MEVTCTLLVSVPAVLPCTLTETAQDPAAAIEPPDKVTEPEPALAVTLPPQELVVPGVEATTMPAGNVSVNATLFRAAVELGLVMLSVRVLVPPTATVVGLKLLEIDGGPATVSGAEAVLPVPPLVDVTAPVVLV